MLIVLMVIGVIATLTVPTLMKNSQDAQYKSAYKKAFTILTLDGTGATCQTKGNMFKNSGTATEMTAAKLLKTACLAIAVDVNGLSKLPNKYESQSVNLDGKTMDPLTGDQYYIWIARDGVTAGSKKHHAGARIMADAK